jgi:hypothetical protein
MRKEYFIHELWIDSHITFPGSLATIGNLFLGTPCHLRRCGMRYSRIREFDREFYFKKEKIYIATHLLCSK